MRSRRKRDVERAQPMSALPSTVTVDVSGRALSAAATVADRSGNTAGPRSTHSRFEPATRSHTKQPGAYE